MYRLGQCTLRYVHQTKDVNYNPIIDIKERVIKCSLMNTFSFNYYQSQTRDMRRSMNLVIPKHYVSDYVVDDVKYKLEYALVGGTKYKVINVLRDKKSSLHSILDLQEVINE